MRKWLLFACMAFVTGNAHAISRPVHGSPAVFESHGNVCFRAQDYYYGNMAIEFLNQERDPDARNLQITRISVGVKGKDEGWEVVHERAPSTGLRMAKKDAFCYGVAPAGFVTVGQAPPLLSGVYTILMEGMDGGDSIRLYAKFCVERYNDSLRVTNCQAPPVEKPSLWRRLIDWLFGDA